MADSVTCPGCKQYPVTLTPTRRLRAHDDGRGHQCPGKGFSMNEPIYPQLVKLWGWETGQRLMKQEFPDWVSPMESAPHSQEALERIVRKAYPSADAIGYAGPMTGPGGGIAFLVGRSSYFAAPDGHVGGPYMRREDAAHALDEHMRAKSA